jgi:hypothetical protein
MVNIMEVVMCLQRDTVKKACNRFRWKIEAVWWRQAANFLYKKLHGVIQS